MIRLFLVALAFFGELAAVVGDSPINGVFDRGSDGIIRGLVVPEVSRVVLFGVALSKLSRAGFLSV